MAGSTPGLVFYISQAQAADGFHHEVVELVGVGAAAGERNALAAVDGAAQRIFLNEGVVARFLYSLPDLVNGLRPRNVFPVIGSRPPHLWLQQPSRIQNVLLERRSLGTQGAAIDGMIRIALHMNHLRRHVLGLVANRVNDDAATHGTVRAGGSRLSGARNL